MHLKNLGLNNFRSFSQAEIPLCKDLTILVGENNGGKSNAIDAIRLLTAPLGGRRELYCEATDIRFGSADRKFELTATFTELNPAQQGRMISAATDAAISGCVFGLKYDETTRRFPVRPVLWGGHQQGNPEPGCHEMIRHVYLPPLRDAKRALASGNPTRIYANLLYMATIAVELEKVNDADLTLFLVEEPEAHLHPQLQAAVLSFLDEQAEKSRKPRVDNQGPAGELQVIVATHSPNLSAWVESKKLVFFRSFLPAPAAAVPPIAEDEPHALAGVPAEIVPEIEPNPVMPVGRPRRETRCIPLAALALDPVERRKVDRYLDVTKSAFLFGGRVLLVEGIAEALLLPVMAKKIVLTDDADKLRLFRSAVFLPIDGVDFQPYAKLLLSPFNEVRIADRLVVLTDGDAGEVAEGAMTPGAGRKRDLEAMVAGLGAGDLLEVVINDYSLETELVRAGNAALLKEVYVKLHPRSADKWDAAVAQAGAAQAVAIQQLFETTRKGDFAQLIAEEINNGKAFTVPAYLKAAIEALVK